MNFKVIHILPEELEDIYPQIAETRGFFPFVQEEAFLFIGAGQKKTDGYDIAVSKVSFEYNSLIVDVTETTPEHTSVKKPNPTYPFTVISPELSAVEFQNLEHIIVRNTVSLKKFNEITIG
ncbi:MAG: protease complex subunit PrcB family protein [Tissierellia bacterium]|nr:protease complex subunit PrcB family protein [Tissierellia bacterium]